MNQTTLTERELQALSLLAHGLSMTSVARRLSISESTLRRTLRAAGERLGAKSTINTVYLATRRGLI